MVDGNSTRSPFEAAKDAKNQLPKIFFLRTSIPKKQIFLMQQLSYRQFFFCSKAQSEFFHFFFNAITT